MDQCDKLLDTASNRLQASYGQGAEAIPWQAILALIASLLGACPAPTPASVKAEFARPFIRLRLLRRLQANGLNCMDANRVVQASADVLKKASDEELTTLINVARDSA